MTYLCLILAVAVIVVAFLWVRDRALSRGEVAKLQSDVVKWSDKHIADLKTLSSTAGKRITELNTQLNTASKHNRVLQAKIAELESERRAYDLTVANYDHLRDENERLASQLEAVGIKPADVMAAEHDRIGFHDWCATAGCLKCNTRYENERRPPGSVTTKRMIE